MARGVRFLLGSRQYPFLKKNGPGIPVFGYCPLYNMYLVQLCSTSESQPFIDSCGTQVYSYQVVCEFTLGVIEVILPMMHVLVVTHSFGCVEMEIVAFQGSYRRQVWRGPLKVSRNL